MRFHFALVLLILCGPVAAQSSYCQQGVTTIDRGTFDAGALTQLTWAGNDSGAWMNFPTQPPLPIYWSGQAIGPHGATIEGLPLGVGITSVLGNSHWTQDGFTGSVFTQGTQHANPPCPGTAGWPCDADTAYFGSINPASQRAGVLLTAGPHLDNTRIRAHGSYCADWNNRLMWEWRVRATTFFASRVAGLATAIDTSGPAVIAAFDLTEGSPLGVELHQVQVDLFNPDPGALSALSNLRIYLDDGATPLVFDAADRQVTVAHAPSGSMVMDTTAGPGATPIIADTTLRFFVVADVDLTQTTAATGFSVRVPYTSMVLPSRLHGEESHKRSTGSLNNHQIVLCPEGPVLSDLSPRTVPLSGGTLVTLTGSGFTNGCTATIDGQSLACTFIDAMTLEVNAPAAASTGPVDVVVVRPATANCPAISSPSLSGVLRYCDDPPGLQVVMPAEGQNNDPVTIHGSGFLPGAVAVFGGTSALTNFVSASELSATIPARAAPGLVDVEVRNPAATPAGCPQESSVLTGGFRYAAPAPSVASVTPSSGSTCGGTLVTITGQEFWAPVTVTFDGIPATGVTIVNATTITALTPPGTEGTVSLAVDNGTAPSALAGFQYLFVPPAITGLNPNTGNYGGGQTVTIDGQGFCAGTRVTFDGREATNVVVLSDQRLQVLTPFLVSRSCATAFAVDVQVILPNGSTAQASQGFTYLPGTVHQVPSQYLTVQGAIDAAVHGDAVLIEGRIGGVSQIYEEAINTRGKAILITASDPFERPQIKVPAGSDRALTMNSGEDSDTVVTCLIFWGGVRIAGSSSPTFTRNQIHNSTTTSPGAGLLIEGGATPFVAYNSIITNTTSSNGGGLAVLGAGTAPTLIGNEIAGNTAGLDGGGLYLGPGIPALTIEAGANPLLAEIRRNEARRHGGGVHSSPTSGLHILRGITLRANTADGWGGALHLLSPGQLRMEDGEVLNNRAQLGGGLAIDGRSSSGGRLEVVRCLIDANRAIGARGFGGGILGYGEQSTATFLTVRESTITDNDAQCGGGIAMVRKIIGEVSRTVVAFNRVALPPMVNPINAVAPWQPPSAMVPDILGGGIFEWDSELRLDGGTLHANTGGLPRSGGGLHAEDGLFGNSLVKNTIFSENLPTEAGWFGVPFGRQGPAGPAAYVHHNAFHHPGGGPLFSSQPPLIEDEIYADPQFVQPTFAARDFMLGAGSPCIDAGDPRSPVPYGGGFRIDIGAIESTPCGSGTGMANSDDARLEINGSATGTCSGPFSATLSPFGSLTVEISGTPGAFALLGVSPVAQAGLATPPIVGQLEIGLSMLAPPIPVVLDSSGQWSVTYPIAGLPSGPIAYLQAVVERPQLGDYRYTASFELRGP